VGDGDQVSRGGDRVSAGRVAAARAEPCTADAIKHEIFWRETEPVRAGPPLEGDVRCDVCVVGGGYTGLWTALLLKQADPAIDVRVLEAADAGAGASGHNDGFITPTIGHSLHTVVRAFGAERAKPAYAALARSIVELRRFCVRHEIDAELEPNGLYLVACNREQRRRLESDVALADSMGVRYRMLAGAEARDRIGSPAIGSALEVPGALVNPHRLVRGLARVARAHGVEIHEGTRAISLAAGSGAHRVATARGSVVADRVVLATNAYQHQFEEFGRRVKPVWSYAMVSEPLDEQRLAQIHWPRREGFVEARNFILFARLTAESRLLIGGGPAPCFRGCDMSERHMRNDAIFDRLRAALARYFPAWRDLRFTHAYGGCIGVTRDLLPHVGALGSGLFYGYGYCGNGIAMAHTAAKAIRDLVLERDSSYSKLLFVRDSPPRFPPEPISHLAIRVVSAVLAWQDRHPRVIRRQLV
jgi:glycine/D-amino acid oxidase-like deaminating enzyme